ncbi:GNAT family N-acetyltransferase [Demequina aurantiaca]|uniref:GNAT family N-acetyltransferase n=1 Tax=Demequina aurantiaca TaxID=676200 RepID=UPI003D355C36
MNIRLVPMSAERLPLWLASSHADYVADLIAAGEIPAVARSRSAQSTSEMFPGGKLKAGHAAFDLVDGDDAEVGYLWIGPDTSEDPGAWWVWDVGVREDQRGRGFGRAAMTLGEQYARDHGASSLGLNVFGFNAPARGLYESLGYQTVSIKMKKSL